MLKTLDVLIGLSVVMMLMSLMVTVLTQFVTGVINSRGRHLLHGVADLLRQIQPDLDQATAKKISAAVLTHPLIRGVGWRFGAIIQRDELTKILLELAAGNGPQTLDRAAAEQLTLALKNSGIDDPKKVIDSVRIKLLDIETSHPELGVSVRNGMALLEHARSPFLAKVNAWFDQTMDRVSQRFTATTRAVAFAMALLVAVVVQLDTPLLVNRLATDPQLRASMVQEAMKVDDKLTNDQRSAELKKLASADLVNVPADFAEWKRGWQGQDPHPTPMGVLLSAFLLSLGAPFWYNGLKNLLRLRSLIARRDDDERTVRQTTQELPGAEKPASPDDAPTLS